MRFRVEVGLLILVFAFVVSFWGSLGISIDLGEQRIIPLLEANPDRYLEYMRDMFLFCILPPAAGLIYSTIAFVRERKTSTAVLRWRLLLMVVGGFFVLWGVYGVWWIYNDYLNVINWINMYGPVEIADSILEICLAAIIGNILWLVTGFLLVLTPILKNANEERRGYTVKIFFNFSL